MLKVLLIDDEERATDALRLMIHKAVPEIQQVWTCNDARKAVEMIHHIQPGLVFLDIQMPHLTGFELLEQLPNKNFKIIFTTAYNEYAVQAIRFSAFDYLLKPVDIEELQASVQRFLAGTEDYRQQFELLKNIMHNISVPSASEFRLALPAREGIHFLQPHEIVRCEAIGNYTRFFLEQGRSYLSTKTLGEYDSLLSSQGFIRTHRSHLVNRRFISFVDHEGWVVLKDNTRIELSRRRKEEVMAALR